MSKLQRIVMIVILAFSAGVLALSSGTWRVTNTRYLSTTRAKVVAIPIGEDPPNRPGATAATRYFGFYLKGTRQTESIPPSAFALVAIFGIVLPVALVGTAFCFYLGGRRADRIARGLCGHCGYDRNESAADARCSECGRFQVR